MTFAEEACEARSRSGEAQFLTLYEGRFYLLPLNNPSTVPADMAPHMSDEDWP